MKENEYLEYKRKNAIIQNDSIQKENDSISNNPESLKEFQDKLDNNSFLKNCTVKDVIISKDFGNILRIEIRKEVELLGYKRRLANSVHKSYPRCTLDSLAEKGYLEVNRFCVLFAEVLDKKNKCLSSNERYLVRSIGMKAFNKTIKKMIDDEKERNNDMR